MTLQPRDRDLAIVLVAGEESGDQLGGPLMRALRERTGGRVSFAGVGGREMAAEGLVSPFPIDELAIIGFAAIPRRLPLILRRIRETAALVVAARPDALVIIDSPDFTHRVARRVRAIAPSIPILDYVSPSVWAWRPGRARAMRSYVDHVLGLLPFEPRAHARLGGPPCSYVGHPLLEQLAELRPSAQEAERRLAEPPVVLVLPGSRGGEIRRLLAIFGETLALLAAGRAPLDLVLPTLPHLRERIAAATADWPLRPRIVVDRKDKRAAFRVARAALAKSGTVTLELALAGIPMVAAYKVSWIEEIVARLALQLPSVILPNLILEENAVPEFLQRDCTAQKLAHALAPLMTESPQRRAQTDAFTRLDAVMRLDAAKAGGSQSPSGRAADIVLGLAKPQAIEAGNT
ncbi:MAG TPA: lipid-A-disaccharide synthase [Xanthobacteraceae bacterium]|jgi:lipid-A-disaccharide synthase|nr:lipid-A-disaccharide synthase [Xanthobacteraceae bacterium]